MRSLLAIAAVVMLASVTAFPSSAGEKKKEGGPEKKVLESLVGTFEAKVKFYLPDPTKPTESTGTLMRKMILDGNVLEESFKGEFFGKPFSGRGMIGYDAHKKKFVTAWADSMSPSISIMHGTWDPDKKTFTSVGEEFDTMLKKNLKMRDVLKVESADEQSFEMFRQPEGETKEFKIMDITYKRKATKK